MRTVFTAIFFILINASFSQGRYYSLSIPDTAHLFCIADLIRLHPTHSYKQIDIEGEYSSEYSFRFSKIRERMQYLPKSLRDSDTIAEVAFEFSQPGTYKTPVIKVYSNDSVLIDTVSSSKDVVILSDQQWDEYYKRHWPAQFKRDSIKQAYSDILNQNQEGWIDSLKKTKCSDTTLSIFAPNIYELSKGERALIMSFETNYPCLDIKNPSQSTIVNKTDLYFHPPLKRSLSLSTVDLYGIPEGVTIPLCDSCPNNDIKVTGVLSKREFKNYAFAGVRSFLEELNDCYWTNHKINLTYSFKKPGKYKFQPLKIRTLNGEIQSEPITVIVQ